MEEEMAATGSANAMTHQFALDHREVVAKFGRYVVIWRVREFRVVFLL